MEKYYVADSYKDAERISDVFKNEKGKKYVRIKSKCEKCGGLGIIVARVENGKPIPIPVDNGICYACWGVGYIEKDVRAYTEKEYKRIQAAKTAREEKKAATAAKRELLIDDPAQYKHQIALKLGFGEDEKAYLVYGDDTYSIKSELKKMGARFDPTLKWFFSQEVELPKGYKLCEISFDEIYEYNPISKWAEFKEDAKNIVSRRIAELKGPSTSEYFPAVVGDRVRNLTARLAASRGFQGTYGYTFVFTFTSGSYVFVWMTSKPLTDFVIGETVDLTGTVKKFDEYMGERQTYLNRCIVKKVEE